MKLHEYLGKRSLPGDFGVEIEVEGQRVPTLDNAGKFWKGVRDGSLRNGWEYIFNKPLTLKQSEAAFKELHDLFVEQRTVLDYSFRTSVHVHMNCLDLTYPQILNFIYIYLLLEEALVNYCGEGRKANRFCLRFQDAEGAHPVLLSLFQHAKWPIFPDMKRIIRHTDSLRYASLNIGALLGHGSLEVRCMRGTNDAKILLPWMEVLKNIRDEAIQYEDPKAVLKMLEDVGPKEFAKNILGDHFELFDYEGLVGGIHMAASLTYDLPNCKQREYIKAPQKVYFGTVEEWDKLARQHGEQAVINALGIRPEPAFAEDDEEDDEGEPVADHEFDR